MEPYSLRTISAHTSAPSLVTIPITSSPVNYIGICTALRPPGYNGLEAGMQGVLRQERSGLMTWKGERGERGEIV